MEVPSNNVQPESSEESLANAFTRLGVVESRMSCLEESVNTAVGNLMPKVEALLSERNEAEGSAASSPAPPPTAAPPPTSLLELAERGDGEALLRMLADERVDLRRHPPRSANGDTALHVAASGGHLHAVMVLLGAGAHVDVLGPRLRTPLHCAVTHGHLAVAQRLLYAGAKIDVKDAEGCSAWDLAVRSDKGMVELFLQEGASVDACNGKGDPVLVQAAKEKRWEIVQLLLERGACATKCQKSQESALFYASRAGQVDVVRSLLRQGASSNINQMEWGLAVAKNAAVVWAFVDVAADKVLGEAPGRSGLRWNARDGRLESMIALLEAGVDVNSKNPSDNKTALFLASGNGRISCVKELLRRGANANAKANDQDSPTALHAASANGHVECVRALLAAGANVTEKNFAGKTPLDVAKTDAVRRLFSGQ